MRAGWERLGVEQSLMIGAQVIPGGGPWTSLKDTWRELDCMGVDMICTDDHFYAPRSSHPHHQLECWTQIAAMAVTTSRAKLGALVTCAAFRAPTLTAHMARTVDFMAPGRCVLGVGLGWDNAEHENTGLTPISLKERCNALEETILRTRQWGAAEVSYEGRKARIPTLIGGNGFKTALPMAAQHADIWNGVGGVLEVAIRSRILDDWCIRAGRPPRDLLRTVVVSTSATQQSLEEYKAIGITGFFVRVSGPDFSLGPVRRLLAWRNAQIDEKP